MGHIYKITLIKNVGSLKEGEVYIGQHKYNVGITNYFTSGTIILNLLINNTLEIFKREIVEDNIDCDLLSDKEKFWIAFYNCNRRRSGKGLNLTDGGSSDYENHSNGRQSLLKYYENPENRKKASLSQKKSYENNPGIAKKHSERQTERYKDPEEIKSASTRRYKFLEENPDFIEKLKFSISKSPTFTCEFCGREVFRESAFKNHVKCCHLNPNKTTIFNHELHNCEFCKKEVKGLGSLRKHENVCLENPNRIVKVNIKLLCICKKECNGKQGLVIHQKVCKIFLEQKN